MRKRKYEAFTLIEMLIVMGILIILMVVGISGGRFALNRANDVAHQNAADQLYQGLQAYYTDHRVFPTDECEIDGASVACTPGNMMEDQDVLGKYLDMGEYNGGTAATFIYFVGGDNGDQAALICVSMRGIQSESDERDDGAYYCTGNGFGADDMESGGVTIDIEKKTIVKDVDPEWDQFYQKTFGLASNWDSVGGVMQWTDYPSPS
jgi:type II secretory pathway pseudopilin PulG